MNRRSVLKKLSLLGASSLLLPSVLSAANDYQSSGPIYIPPGEGNKARIGEMEVVFKFDKSQTSSWCFRNYHSARGIGCPSTFTQKHR